MTWTLHHGDCREVLAQLPDASVDAVVTDPPYGLEFMGKDWDAPWQASSKSALFGDRATKVPGFGNQRNANCKACGGRLRGANRCACDVPEWDESPASTNNRQMVAFQLWCQEWAEEALRVLKPGGHLLAFGGTRTYHRMTCAIEDAGFEVRDSLHWLYGSGFPKSLDVSKAIDKAAGAEREVVGDKLDRPGYHLSGHDGGEAFGHGLSSFTPETRLKAAQITTPATDAAARWEGWGTALKPAHEPVVVARKPLAGTVAQNVQAHGTGAINIDGCRVGTDEVVSRGGIAPGSGNLVGGPNLYREPTTSFGRWPANLVLTHSAACGDECAEDCPVAELDRQSGWQRDGVAVRRNGTAGGTIGPPGAKPVGTADMGYGGSGGASRFFPVTEWDAPFLYVAKPDKAERNAGLDGLPEVRKPMLERSASGAELLDPVSERFLSKPTANHHPTVKPLDLMRWLVRLVTPPGGTVLDPFAGSGTTLAAGLLEGFDVVGVELTDEYLPLIEGRCRWAEREARFGPVQGPTKVRKDAGAPTLFDEGDAA